MDISILPEGVLEQALTDEGVTPKKKMKEEDF